MDLVKSNGELNQPVKIVLERRVRPGAKEHFESWVKQLAESASQSPALQGSSVLKTGDGQYFILFRFASQADLDRWQALPEVSELLKKGEALAVAVEQPAVRTGFETWFTLPGVSGSLTPPPKWKMSLVTWLALLPQVIILGMIVPKEWPVLLRAAISTAIPVVMLTWVIMPRLTKLLYRWLYAAQNHPR